MQPELNQSQNTKALLEMDNPSPVETVFAKDSPLHRADFRIIEVTFTFPDYDPMIFRFRRQLSKDLKAAKDQFYGLTEEEQSKQIVTFRINQLASLLVEAPENIPGISEFDDYRQAFIDYFSEDSEMMGWLWGQYQLKLYPKEILSSPLD